MKTLQFFALLLASPLASAEAASSGPMDEFVGLGYGEVRALLGEPRAALSHDSITIARFDTVTLRLEDNLVVAQEAADPSERESRVEMLARVTREKEQVGLRLFERYQASGETRQLAPRQELEFWLAFQRKYPEVELAPTLERARHRVQLEQAREAQAEQDAEIAYLRDRVDRLQGSYRSGYSRGPRYVSPYGYYTRHRTPERGSKWRDGYDDRRNGSEDRRERSGDRPGQGGVLDPAPNSHRTPAGPTPGPVAPILNRP